MKLERSRTWYEERIALEGDLEVGAGSPPREFTGTPPASNITPVDTRIAFGTFVELWRRNQGWDAVRLAEEAGVNPEEILEIERNPQSAPRTGTVHRLASIFGMSPRPLLELAGLVEPSTPRLREAAVRFAARSESVAALNPNEREAFEAFVSTIAKQG